MCHVRQPEVKEVEENWILITYDIPRTEETIRKSVLRRLHRLGALQFTESVYYLPYSREGIVAAREVCKGAGSVFAWYSKIEGEQARELTAKYVLDITSAIENLETKVWQLENMVDYDPKKASSKIKELRQTYQQLHTAVGLIEAPPLLWERLSDVRQRLDAANARLRESDEKG
jgi:hypothetical protein